MTGSIASASDEFVEIAHQSSSFIELSSIELQYLSASGSSWSTKATLSGWLWPAGRLTLATSSLAVSDSQLLAGGLAAGGGHLRLVRRDGDVLTELDRIGWGTAVEPETSAAVAPAAGSSLKRKIDLDGRFIDSQNNAQDFESSEQPDPQSNNLDLTSVCSIVFPMVTEEETNSTPEEEEISSDETDNDSLPTGTTAATETPPTTYPTLIISELLVDPASPTTDSEDEFIELFNPNDFDVDISGYQLQSGSNYQYVYQIPAQLLGAGHYVAFLAIDTRLALANNGSNVRLVDPAGQVVGEIVNYPRAKTGQSWSRTGNGSWQWTPLLTPSQANQFEASSGPTDTVAASSLQGGGSDKETMPSSTVATNSVSTEETLASDALVTGSESTVLVVAGVIALLYALYEYRHEMLRFFQKRSSDYRHWRQHRRQLARRRNHRADQRCRWWQNDIRAWFSARYREQ